MTVKKATKIVAKKKRVQKKSNSDTEYMTFTSEGQLIPSQGLTVTNYLYTAVPLITSTTAIGCTQLKEFVLYNNQYDQVRINSVTVRYIPKANVLSQVDAQLDAVYNLAGDGLIHHVIDRDDNAPSNVGSLQRYPSYRKSQIFKPFTRRYSVTYPPGVWLDSQNIYSDETLLRRLGCFGGVYMYAENILEDLNEIFNEPMATIQVTYGVVFRGKTSGNLAYNTETGAITITPLLQAANAPLTQILGVRNSVIDNHLVQDVSGGDGIQIEYNDSGVDTFTRGGD